jgi:glycine/D-amino acid oxidase-like deaminating enzyme
MHGFINSPALAKLVALQMVDEELQRNPSRPSRRTRTPFRARLAARRTAHAAAPAPRVKPTGKLVEEGR